MRLAESPCLHDYTARPRPCRRADEIGQEFKQALAKGETCPDMGAPPVLAEPAINKIVVKSLERQQARGEPADLERERSKTLESLYSGVKTFMSSALGLGKSECQKSLFEGTDYVPVVTDGMSAEEKALEKVKCGCSSCPCDPAVCLSLELQATVSAYADVGLKPGTDWQRPGRAICYSRPPYCT